MSKTQSSRTAPKVVTPAPQIETSQERWNRETAERAAKLNLVGMLDSERAFLATCQKIYEQWEGDTSPAENFVVSLVKEFNQEDGNSLTPETAGHYLTEFRDLFAKVKESTTAFARRYPEFFKEPQDFVEAGVA